jgi:transposase InsO family protein
VTQASGIEVIHAPYAAPRANATCERFIGSLRRECLDQVLEMGALQLTRILKEYIAYFNQARPHLHLRSGVSVRGSRKVNGGQSYDRLENRERERYWRSQY